MFERIKKRILVVFLLLSYCSGVLFSPIHAENTDGFDALLSEREGSASVSQIQKKKTQIEDFTDVKRADWFYDYLDYLVKNEIVNGKTETTFEPSSTFSYAECSAVIVRYLGLEDEASERKQAIDKRHPEMKNLWYAGYFEVLSEFGIFEDYGIFKTDKKGISHIDKDMANSPILRYRFAESISESFELDGSLYAKNVYSEVGGKGREFIIGAGYDSDILEMYKPLIKDFDEIPEQSRENVLKAYYNGIFNGDISGNFYPLNNLTRGEMAKVLATILDFSQRTRLITEGYGEATVDNMLHTDPFGVSTLGYDYWTTLLEKEVQNLNVDFGEIRYTKDSSNAYYGYCTDVYLYKKNGDVYSYITGATLHDKSDGFEYSAQNAKVLFVLRNLTENARPEGVFEVVVENGIIVSASPCVMEMPMEENAEAQSVAENGIQTVF